MAQVMVSIEIDKELKDSFEQLLADIGLSLEEAVTLFFEAVVREKRIPFDYSVDEKSYVKAGSYEKMTNREAWDFAIGLVQIDGIKPSDDFMKLVEQEISGELTGEDIRRILNDKYDAKVKEKNEN